MILIDSVERRIRSMGHEPVRAFDARRWTLSVDDRIIASAPSLGELALAAEAWVRARLSPQPDGVRNAPRVQS